MMKENNGSISINVEGDHFRLVAESQDHKMSMELNLEMMQILSLSLSKLLSVHRNQLTDGAESPPIIDIVSPQVSFSPGRMGVEMTVLGHALAPIKLTFPLNQALEVTKGILDNMQDSALKMGLDLSKDP